MKHLYVRFMKGARTGTDRTRENNQVNACVSERKLQHVLPVVEMQKRMRAEWECMKRCVLITFRKGSFGWDVCRHFLKPPPLGTMLR